MATLDEVYELLDTINKQTLKRMETDNANVFKRIEERFNQPKTMATIDQVYELLDAVNKQTLKRMETDNANAFKRIEERFNQLQESGLNIASGLRDIRERILTPMQQEVHAIKRKVGALTAEEKAAKKEAKKLEKKTKPKLKSK